MATYVRETTPVVEERSSGLGSILGVALLLLALLLLVAYGLPALRHSNTRTNTVNVTTPSGTSSGSVTTPAQ